MLCVRLFGLAADCPAAQDRPDRERTRIRMLVMLTQVLAADGEADRIDPRKFERIWNVVSPIPDDRTQGVEEPLACLSRPSRTTATLCQTISSRRPSIRLRH